MDSFQPDSFVSDDSSDSFQPDNSFPVAEKKKSVFPLGQAMDNYKISPAYQTSPVGMLNMIPDLASKAAGKVGEYVSSNLAKEGMNPYGAAAVGTVVSMGPDVAMMASPESEITPKSMFRSTSEPLAQRSLGLTKRFLNTPQAREKAAQAAQVALENNVIPWSGNPATALQNAVDLQRQSGEALGSMREAAGASPLDQVFGSLEAARQEATGGLHGGAWDKIHGKFDEASDTLKALLANGENVHLKDVERAKKILSDTVNWISDNVSQRTAKNISNAIENGVESIMKSKGLDMSAYEAQKRIYGATKTMQKGLSNEIAAQAGNNAVSLPTMVAGAGQLATGNVPGAIATLGVVEGLRRRGAGIAANLFNRAGNLPGSILAATRVPNPILGAIQTGSRLLPTSDPSGIAVNQAANKFRGLLSYPKKSASGNPNSGQPDMGQPSDNGYEQPNQNNDNGYFESQENHKAPILSTSKPKAQAKPQILSKDKAREFLDQANGDRNLARKLAKKAGFTW